MKPPVKASDPLRVLISRSPFARRAWADTSVVGSGLLSVFTATVVITLAATAVSLVPTTVLAPPILAALYWCGDRFTGWQLARFRRLAHVEIHAAGTDAPDWTASWLRRVWTRTRSGATWRRLTYHGLSGFVDSAGFCVVFGLWAAGFGLTTVSLWSWALPSHGGVFGHSVHGTGRLVYLTVLGIIAFFVAPTAARLIARMEVAMATAMLSVSAKDRLTSQVDSLARSRTEVIDAADAERRRIERDLHDGAQQRLVSLAMSLGMTRTMLTDVPEPVRSAVEQAHEEAKQALIELRDFVRGLHPAVLDDLGLDAALSGIAARSPIPVRLLVELPGRLPRAVETVAYFVVSEAMANAAKHSRATQVDVVVEQLSAVVRVIVSDNGHGGADETKGSGLRGLGQRIRSLEGTLIVDSPAGGPTLLVAELPCAS